MPKNTKASKQLSTIIGYYEGSDAKEQLQTGEDEEEGDKVVENYNKIKFISCVG